MSLLLYSNRKNIVDFNTQQTYTELQNTHTQTITELRDTWIHSQHFSYRLDLRQISRQTHHASQISLNTKDSHRASLFNIEH